MKKITFLLVTLAAVSVLYACEGQRKPALTDTSEANTGNNRPEGYDMTSPPADISDTTFASNVAISGMAEVALGKMAAAKGTLPEIKAFGNMMTMDHGKANAELLGIAKNKKLTLPTRLDAEHQAKSDSLSKLSGKDFDRGYAQVMLEGHQKTLTLMDREAESGQDADLKAFAKKTKPIIENHLKEITKIRSSIK
jgi:putative membrane protein